MAVRERHGDSARVAVRERHGDSARWRSEKDMEIALEIAGGGQRKTWR